jgi:hypothetical protein
VRPLLHHPGLIHHQDRLRVAQVLDHVRPQVVADRLGIPVGAPQQMLQGVGRPIPDRLGQLPAVLALDRAE